MYKRISHNIVEEHFDHPLAVELKDKIANTTGNIHPKFGSVNAGPGLHMNQDISKLVGHIRNYIVSEIASAEDVDYAKNQVLSDVTSIKNSIVKHYSSDIGDAVLTHLTGIVTSLVTLLGAAKASKDIEPYKAIVLSHADALATVLAEANPSKWGRSVNVKSYLDQYIGLLIDQAGARIAGDWAADEEAAIKATNLMCNGPVTFGSLSGKPDFEHVYRSGLYGYNWF